MVDLGERHADGNVIAVTTSESLDVTETNRIEILRAAVSNDVIIMTRDRKMGEPRSCCSHRMVHIKASGPFRRQRNEETTGHIFLVCVSSWDVLRRTSLPKLVAPPFVTFLVASVVVHDNPCPV